MTGSSFRVDTVPTPRLDLYGALLKDLQCYAQNQHSLPPAPRSALAAEQEKINKFLQYVNESFIIKGFSKYNPVPEEAVDSDVTAVFTDGPLTFGQSMSAFARFTVGCLYVSHLYIHWSLDGKFLPASDGSTGCLEVQLLINNASVAQWRQDLAEGYAGAHRAVFLPDRSAGEYAVELTARVSAGSFQLQTGGGHAAAYAKLKTRQQ